MNEVSILRLKFNYSDLQTLTLFFMQIDILTPLLLIVLVVILRQILFGIVAVINGNKVWKYAHIVINSILKRRYWGIIVNESTYKTVGFAKIRLIKFEKNKDVIKKKVLASTLSDYRGRYYFDYKGEYKNLFLEVNAMGYKKFYKEIDTLNHLSINSEMVYDAYLTPKSKAIKTSTLTLIINLVSNVLLFIAAVIGLLLSIYKELTVSDNTAFLMCAVYIFILYFAISNLLKRFTLKKFEILESLLMQKIPGAVVRLYDSKHQLHIAVTNKKGFVLIDWIPGESQILVTKKGYELIDESTGTKNQKIFLTHNNYVRLKKKFRTITHFTTTPKDIKVRTSLQNPFTTNNI